MTPEPRIELDGGLVAYLGASWADLADLVAADGEFDFSAVDETTRTRLYEHGRWHRDDEITRPGIQRLWEMISDGEVPYVLFRSYTENPGDIPGELRDCLVGQVKKIKFDLFLDTGVATLLLFHAGEIPASMALELCTSFDWSRRDRARRVPLVLREMALELRGEVLRSLTRGPLIHHQKRFTRAQGTSVFQVSGVESERVYVFSERRGGPEMLRNAGLRLRREERTGVSRLFIEAVAEDVVALGMSHQVLSESAAVIVVDGLGRCSTASFSKKSVRDAMLHGFVVFNATPEVGDETMRRVLEAINSNSEWTINSDDDNDEVGDE